MRRAEFLSAAVARVAQVLRSHGYEPQFEELSLGSELWLGATFTFRGVPHDVGIHADDRRGNDVNMYAGEQREQLYECFLRGEYATDEALIESFAKRLDRYLSGQAWDDPTDYEPRGSVARLFKKLR